MSEKEPTFYVRIPGPPCAQGRPRFSTKGGRLRTYDPAKSRAWKKVAAQYMALELLKVRTWLTMKKTSIETHGQFLGPVEMTIEFVFPRPVRLQRKSDRAPTTREFRVERPDIENLVKAVMDAAQTAGIYRDDSQVVRLIAVKLHAAMGEAPAVMVSIQSLA